MQRSQPGERPVDRLLRMVDRGRLRQRHVPIETGKDGTVRGRVDQSEAVADHVDIACLEDAQRQLRAGKKDQAERKQRKRVGQNHGSDPRVRQTRASAG